MWCVTGTIELLFYQFQVLSVVAKDINRRNVPKEAHWDCVTNVKGAETTLYFMR